MTMKKFFSFTGTFLLFMFIAQLCFMALAIVIYFSASFVAWQWLFLDSLEELVIAMFRITLVVSFFFTLRWIFIEGRENWA